MALPPPGGSPARPGEQGSPPGGGYCPRYCFKPFMCSPAEAFGGGAGSSRHKRAPRWRRSDPRRGRGRAGRGARPVGQVTYVEHTPPSRDPASFPPRLLFFSGDFLYLGSRWVENSSTPPSPIHPPGRLPASLPSPTGRVGDPRCTGGSARDAAGRGGRLPPAALQVEARAGPSAPAIKRKAPEQDALLPALPAGTKVPRSPSPR